MIIERDVNRWCVDAEAPVSEVLKRLDANHQGFILGVDESGVLEGVLTDGDVRRWLMTQSVVNLQAKDLSDQDIADVAAYFSMQKGDLGDLATAH